MPHTESAKKRLRQNEKRRLRNKAASTELKTIRKQLLRSLHDGKPDDAKGLYQDLTKALDRAAGAKVIHRNAANRAKSRLQLKINAAKSGAPTKTSPTKTSPTKTSPTKTSPTKTSPTKA